MLGCRRDQLGKTQRKRELIFCLGDFFCAPFGNCFHLWWFDSFLLALAFSGFGLLAVVGFCWLLAFAFRGVVCTAARCKKVLALSVPLQ